MTAPFRVEPESSKRPAQQDPFLEFESERPSASLFPGEEPWKPLALPEPTPAQPERRDTAINPTIAFALAVAGLVTATVGYFQMGQLLAGRSQASATVASGAPGSSPLAPPLPTTGRLEISSDPAGASVTVDGTSRGATPLTLKDINPGRHQVVISRGQSVVTRSVDLTAGATSVVTAVMATAPAPAPVTTSTRPSASNGAATAGATGWVTFDSPLDFQILERGRLRGSSRLARLPLSEGSHQLEIVNEALEVRQTIATSIVAGRGTPVRIPLPTGLLSVNATPWADVWIDGIAVGTTPLANLSVPVGSHQVLLKHPTLGERQQTVVVKAVTPGRLGINLGR